MRPAVWLLRQCGSCTPAAVNEVLSVKYEVYNPYDHYAIALKKRLPGDITCSVVGHMQMKELSRFIMLHGASVAAEIIKRLEIPVDVSVVMLFRIKIKQNVLSTY